MSIRTLRASDNHATVGGNVNTSHGLVMALEFILEDKFGSGFLVELDIVVSCNSKGLAIGGEGMVGNRVVKEVMNFGTRHGGRRDLG